MPQERESSDYLASELRQGAGEEWRLEAAEDELQTELYRRRQRDLATVLLEAVHRGDRVRAELTDRSFSGPAIYAGADFVTLDADESHIDIVTTGVTWFIERRNEGGRDQSGDRLSFKARLAETAHRAESVRVVTSTGQVRMGPISAVAADHIELGGQDAEVLIPLEMILAVIRPKAPQ